MSFASIDATIRTWATDNNIRLFTKDRDWEIRSFRIDDSVKKGRNFQIWIDVPDATGHTLVHLSNLQNPAEKREFRVNSNELKSALDKALKIALGSNPN